VTEDRQLILVNFAFIIDVQRQPVFRWYDAMTTGRVYSTVTTATAVAEMLVAFRAISHYIKSNQAAVADVTLNWSAYELRDGCFYLVKILA
jgi:hypothetical protein